MNLNERLARVLAGYLHGDDFGWQDRQGAAAAILREIESSGMVIVPREPNVAMLKAGSRAIEEAECTPIPDQDDPNYVWGMSWLNEARACHAAMISASTGGGDHG